MHGTPPSSTASDVTDRIAAFLTTFPDSRIGPAIHETVARAFLDTTAVAVAAREEAAAKIVDEYLGGNSSPRPATAWGNSARIPAEDAALLNGVLAHVLDYDDVTPPMRGHPSAVLLPPLAALGEQEGASCAELSTAYAAGFEVLCGLARCGVHRQYTRGWFSTAVIGLLAATAGCARLLGLDHSQTVHALGIAAGHASGVQANFGSMSKALQAGNAAANAVRAARLARLGYTASPAGGLDGPAGYLALYFPDFDEGDGLRLGADPLEIIASGIGVKRFPNCFSVHRPAEAIFHLRDRHGFAGADVAQVDVRTNATALRPLIGHLPGDPLEARFSMEYTVAVALNDETLTLAGFTPEQLARSELRRDMAKVRAQEADGEPAPRWARVRVTLEDGTTYEHRVEDLHGGPGDPLTVAELQDKVTQCFRYAGVPNAPDAGDLIKSWPELSVADAVSAIVGK